MDQSKYQIKNELLNLSFTEEQIAQVLPSADSLEQAVELLLALQEGQHTIKQNNGLFAEINAIEFDDHMQPNFDFNKRYKMVCVVRMDLKMGIGKIAAQTGHAVLGAYQQLLNDKNVLLQKWEGSGQAKVVLKCESQQELFNIEAKARQNGLNTYLVTDAGRTQVQPGSQTVCAIGPADCDLIDQVTGHLKLL
ncbi:unnamed protein product (macronuclear) [Paramecium tetraurelia]|uniref:peptidyl-tRNA hydrolase n=1 Tax=Paramecium tetraurelia TaxID=5888 RepID=A0BTK3_PARTE|nr:uncharacterized protein GSPATT00032102001 [Paramecium tetraurelia]CAK61870.1 unnamed protein product [Paramecium tetraurelia]|eukprot:XP_001429268.1 hypothetical protein (macronuclear) [Paramecium tetraurelia strain d4-2]